MAGRSPPGGLLPRNGMAGRVFSLAASRPALALGAGRPDAADELNAREVFHRAWMCAWLRGGVRARGQARRQKGCSARRQGSRADGKRASARHRCSSRARMLRRWRWRLSWAGGSRCLMKAWGTCGRRARAWPCALARCHALHGGRRLCSRCALVHATLARNCPHAVHGAAALPRASHGATAHRLCAPFQLYAWHAVALCCCANSSSPQLVPRRSRRACPHDCAPLAHPPAHVSDLLSLATSRLQLVPVQCRGRPHQGRAVAHDGAREVHIPRANGSSIRWVWPRRRHPPLVGRRLEGAGRTPALPCVWRCALAPRAPRGAVGAS